MIMTEKDGGVVNQQQDVAIHQEMWSSMKHLRDGHHKQDLGSFLYLFDVLTLFHSPSIDSPCGAPSSLDYFSSPLECSSSCCTNVSSIFLESRSVVACDDHHEDASSKTTFPDV